MVFENFDSSKIEKSSKSSLNVDLHEYSSFTKATISAKTDASSSNLSNASIQSDGSITFGPTDNIYQSSAQNDNIYQSLASNDKKKTTDQPDNKTEQPDKKTLDEISDPNSGSADKSGKVLHALDEMWKKGFKQKDANGNEYVSINFGDKLSARVGGGYHIQYQDGRNYKDYYPDGSVGLGFNDGNINGCIIMHPDGTIERRGGL